MTKTKQNFVLLNKAVYFPGIKTLALADLHLGYEYLLKNQGLEIPLNQLAHTQKEVKEVMENLRNQNLQVNKIVIVGDLKHHFHFEIQETLDIRNFLRFLEEFVKRENIILIKGNHEKIELDKELYTNYHIENGIAFAHGDNLFPELLDKKIKTLVLGHVHPAINLKETSGVKKEKYKCFLVGKWKGKQTIILPSFFPFIEGTPMEVGDKEYNYFDKFFIIKKQNLEKFDVYITDKEQVYHFGKLRNI